MLEESSTSCTLPFLQLVLLDWFLTLGAQFLGVYTVIYRHPLTLDSGHLLTFLHDFSWNWCHDYPITHQVSLSQCFIAIDPVPTVRYFEMFGPLGKKHEEEEVQIRGDFQFSKWGTSSFLVSFLEFFPHLFKGTHDNLHLGGLLS